MNKKNRFHLGFSTVEVLISLIFVGIAFLVFSGTFNLNRLVKSTGYQNIARHIAIEEMEALRATDFANLPPSGSIADPDLTQLPMGSAQRTVTEIDASLKEIQMQVTWQEEAEVKTVELTSYFYKNGLNNL